MSHALPNKSEEYEGDPPDEANDHQQSDAYFLKLTPETHKPAPSAINETEHQASIPLATILAQEEDVLKDQEMQKNLPTFKTRRTTGGI